MRKTLLTLSLLTLVTMSLLAIPAKKTIKTFRQSDGTEIQLQLMGDEFTHYLATEDGIPVILNQEGNYEYAILNEQAAPVSPRRLVAQQKRITRPVQATKNLVILMNFKDKSFTGTDPQKAFSNLLNQKNYADNGGTGSVKDYFELASNGKYIPQFDVYGPYTASQNLNYYGQNDSEGFDLHADQLIVEACRLADAAGVDFSLYDADKDGYVDNVSVFYAGYSEAEWAPENTIWPHQYYLSAT